MKIRIQNGLPFVAASLVYHGQTLTLDEVLLDTGSGGSAFSTDKFLAIGLWYEMDDIAHRIRGVGGSEFVFTKRIEQLALGDLQVDNFEIEVGAMGYGFEIDGIIGMDFLTQIGAVIDLGRLEVHRAE